MRNTHHYQNKWLGFGVLLFACLVFALTAGTSRAFAFSGTGAGTSNDPYQIDNCSKWLEMANDLSGFYALKGDIDCTGTTYTPIGTSGSPFTGTLDGRGWKITGVSITSGTTIGLFGYTSGATLKNLYFASSTISGNAWMGGLVADASNGTISNVHSTVNVTGTSGTIGGLVGIGHGTTTIEKSSFTGTVTGGSSYVGGLIARLEGNMTVNDSYAVGTITAGTNSYVGGFAGAVLSGSPVVSRSYAAMTFTNVGTYNGGFIGGFFGGTVINSFSASTMTSAAGTLSGGMFGVGDGTSTNNYFDRYLANRSACTGNGAAACTGVNVADATPNYFKNNSTNAPLDTWNFTSPWYTSSSNYPKLLTLATSITVCEVPTQTSSSFRLFCDVQSVGDIGSVTWTGRYRVSGTSTWTAVTLADSSVGVMNVSGLLPSTTYQIGLLYTSSIYGDGLWITTEITTSAADSGGQGGGSNATVATQSNKNTNVSLASTEIDQNNETVPLAPESNTSEPTKESEASASDSEELSSGRVMIYVLAGGAVLVLFVLGSVYTKP